MIPLDFELLRWSWTPLKHRCANDHDHSPPKAFDVPYPWASPPAAFVLVSLALVVLLCCAPPSARPRDPAILLPSSLVQESGPEIQTARRSMPAPPVAPSRVVTPTTAPALVTIGSVPAPATAMPVPALRALWLPSACAPPKVAACIRSAGGTQSLGVLGVALVLAVGSLVHNRWARGPKGSLHESLLISLVPVIFLALPPPSPAQIISLPQDSTAAVPAPERKPLYQVYEMPKPPQCPSEPFQAQDCLSPTHQSPFLSAPPSALPPTQPLPRDKVRGQGNEGDQGRYGAGQTVEREFAH